MPVPKEIEVKLAVGSHHAVAKAVRAAGGVFLGSFLQTDRFFDWPDRSLRLSDCGLRVRTVRRLRGPAGRPRVRHLVTFKGPRLARKGIKIRPEHETGIDDPEVLIDILQALGLRPMLTIQKRRSRYRLGRCQVELDELPALGRFVEVEGKSERAVLSLCRRLGLRGEGITRSYVAMIDAHYGGLPDGAEVTFASPLPARSRRRRAARA